MNELEPQNEIFDLFNMFTVKHRLIVPLYIIVSILISLLDSCKLRIVASYDLKFIPMSNLILGTNHHYGSYYDPEYD